ncbi:MAG TPA: hypothetical protein VMF51_20965 [Nocardioides sp.]|uniref:TolB family protein n=1 Tax=Nocardioides sp. TaxID=35761 RepID=UPI002C66B167|nr:hypothetical protein [Nocardioides sp.]HTW17613.1 hypothetical protein [Nocardioides sp.]
MNISGRGALATLIALLACAPAAVAAGSTPSPATPMVGAERLAAPKVGHRVVWDHYRRGVKGIHLRSARVDGTGVRRIYDLPKGFTTSLTMDGAGRRVAFATCCSDRLPQLVVAPVRGGKPIEPLARHPHLVAVGGIGWSHDGRRLAFEAVSERNGERVHGIWTVRLDGRELTQVLVLPSPDEHHQVVINDALGWTRDGILYSDGTNLRSARAGHSKLVLRNVRSVRITGDHRRIVIERRRGERSSTWIAAADGGHARRLLSNGKPGVTTIYHDVTPNRDGTELLAYRARPTADGPDDTDVIVWSVGRKVRSATELPVVAGNPTVTWN